MPAQFDEKLETGIVSPLDNLSAISDDRVHPRRAKGDSMQQRARPTLGGTIC
jgi:hypothetical protein